MLQICTDVRAVHAQGVVPVRAGDMMCLGQRFSEVATDEILVSQLCPEGRTVSDTVWIVGSPIEVTAQADTIDVSTVVVELYFLWQSAVTFIAVTVLVPVDAAVQF